MAASSCTLLFACLAALHTTHPGVPFVSALDLDAQRNILQEELRLPAPETQEGLPVTTSVPSSLSPGDEISARVLGENSSEAAEDDPQRGCGKDIPPEKMHKIAEAVMKLGADLLREVELEDSRSNLFFSPYSVSLALAHLALGAANQTEKQLLEALHMESVPCLHQALHGLSQHLGKAVLSIAAQLYLQKGFPFKEKFLEDSEKFYGAKPATLTGNSETDLATINNWVKEATDGQISTMLTELPASVVMVLLNAVHFQGFWKNKFDPLLTKPSVFHLDDEHTVSVEMMRARDYPLSWFTLESLDVKVARFPFKGNTSFVVVLPNHPERNFSRLLSDLSHRNLHGTFPKERPTIVKMPKLHLQYHLDLKQALSRLAAAHWVDILIVLSTTTPRYLSWSVTASSDPMSVYVKLRFFAPICIILHLFILNCICHFSAHSLSLERSFWSSSQSLFVLTTLNNLVSSANISSWNLHQRQAV
ncbi:alpha-2-antiplasmin isoform X3 [Rhineura floridana]|uniref:alpha-2-antiplasmin isoform X3 n=1 Tax=Rhineura floridana TaxID=261503 RepID=UPI002AC88DAC|nr:alpha-2-antiplasmin isoform X3 [Rhineura floridana]